jgi:hypothetical protein
LLLVCGWSRFAFPEKMIVQDSAWRWHTESSVLVQMRDFCFSSNCAGGWSAISSFRCLVLTAKTFSIWKVWGAMVAWVGLENHNTPHRIHFETWEKPVSKKSKHLRMKNKVLGNRDWTLRQAIHNWYPANRCMNFRSPLFIRLDMEVRNWAKRGKHMIRCSLQSLRAMIDESMTCLFALEFIFVHERRDMPSFGTNQTMQAHQRTQGGNPVEISQTTAIGARRLI